MVRTAVLVSGGVDSAVALSLLAARGEGSLEAFYLKIWLEDEMAFLGRCPWQEDLGFVRQACAVAGVPLSVVSLQRAYFERVVAVDPAAAEAWRGLGEALARLGEHELSRRMYDRAQEIEREPEAGGWRK